jgi:hypothetical protein
VADLRLDEAPINTVLGEVGEAECRIEWGTSVFGNFNASR